MHTYMNDKDLNSLTDEDLLFLVRAFATKHKEYREIIEFARSDKKVLLQMIDDQRVFSALTNPEQRVLSVSTFFFFFQIIRHAFHEYAHYHDFLKKVNLYRESHGNYILSEEEITRILDDIQLQIYMANMLTFFSTSAKMNDPQKTQNGWIYITDLLQKIEEASPVNEFMLKAFIGNYTLCLTSLYKEFVEEKYRYGKRLLDCEYYAEFGQKYFVSAAHSKIAEESGLSNTLESLGVGFHIVRFALDELKHKDHFYGCFVA